MQQDVTYYYYYYYYVFLKLKLHYAISEPSTAVLLMHFFSNVKLCCLVCVSRHFETSSAFTVISRKVQEASQTHHIVAVQYFSSRRPIIQNARSYCGIPTSAVHRNTTPKLLAVRIQK